jgi:MFS family permease
MTAPTKTASRDTRILGLVCTGHFMSHYSQLAIAPLFPLMHAEFGVGYAALGLIITLINASGALVQIPVGFLVDRIGGKKVLIIGLLIKTAAIGAMALTNSYEMLLVLAVIAGLGHSVFHPADYAILMSSIDSRRIGRAFSIHTAAGNAGSALAPMAVLMIAQFFNWQAALLSIAIFGALTGIAMMLQANILADHVGARKKSGKRSPARKAGDIVEGIKGFLKADVMVLYVFFVITAMVSVGLNSFTVSILVNLHGISLSVAGATLTAFLAAGFAGVLLGGVFADRTDRHEMVAAVAFSGSAVLILLIGFYKMSPLLLVGAYAMVGVLLGLVRPARDMMVRAITPEGDAGKMFGFMSNGHFTGGAIVPILFGWIIDQGAYEWVYWITAAFLVMALLTVVKPRKRVTKNKEEN